MTLDNFAISVFANLVTERLNRLSERWNSSESELAPEEEEALSSKPCKEQRPRSRDFSIDVLEEFLDIVRDPVIHIVMESEPSTFYFTVATILESSATGEWYVFGIGQLALQGMGGGHKRFEQLLRIIQRRNPPVAIWCSSNIDMEAIEEGEITWLELKPRLAPFLSVIHHFEGFQEVLFRVKASFPKHASVMELS